MVGIVVVSHSAKLAEGVVELARGMGGEDVRIEPAGGVAEAEGALGTDAMLVVRAIERADAGDGVLVLMDLGSAVLSAEMALDLLEPGRDGQVLLCEAPLVEGAVAAAVTARTGASLDDVAAEARGGLAPKAAHLGAELGAEVAAPKAQAGERGGALSLRLVVDNPLGLHARPAARFVRTVSGFDAAVEVTNATTGSGPASGRSLNALATLGVREGHELLVTASGPQAQEALAALRSLAAERFGDEPETVPARTVTVVASAARPDGALAGLAAAPGAAHGPARHLRPPVPDVPPHRTADPEAEWDRLDAALARVRHELGETRRSVAARAGEYAAAIFDAHLLLLADETLVEPARRAIFDEERNAADAWSRATEAAAGAYAALEDEYQRARADDVRAVGRAVVAELVGAPTRPILEEAGIVVAIDLAPHETAALDASLVRGIATAYGGPTSHSAILARSLGLPAVVGLGEEVLAVPEGAELLLDGDAGLVHVEPGDELLAELETRERRREQAARVALGAAAEPAQTRDGQRIEVAVNIGSPDEVEPAVAAGADGVGLLRTEFLFLERAEPPGELVQAEVYATIAERLAGRPLVVRTLDVGGDKPLPWLPRRVEANPFLGVRGIRLGLAEPELLETQLRALLRVAARYPLKVMFPMVATLDEYRDALATLERLAREAGMETAARGKLEVGIMVEVPSAALSAELFAPEVDFFSIGTNDLSQYTMAAERGSRAVASLADALQPAVLRLVRTVTEAAAGRGKWVGVCGEIASDPIAVPLLLGLGVTELSVAPPALPAVKQAVRGVDLEEAQALAEAALALASAADVRALVAVEPSPRGA